MMFFSRIDFLRFYFILKFIRSYFCLVKPLQWLAFVTVFVLLPTKLLLSRVESADTFTYQFA